MSRVKLNQILEGIKAKIKDKSTQDQQLRKNRSNQANHTIVIDAREVANEIADFVERAAEEDLILTPSQEAQINKLVQSFCRDVFNNFKLLKAQTVTRFKIYGTPQRFSITISKTKGSPRVFDQALRGGLNPFLGKLETAVQNLFQGPDWWSRDTGGRNRSIFHLGHMEGFSIAEQAPQLFLDPSERELASTIEEEEIRITLEKFGLMDPQKRFVRVRLENSKSNQNTKGKEEANLIKEQVRAIEEYFQSLDLSELSGSPTIKEEIFDALRTGAQGKKYNKKLYTKVQGSVKEKIVNTRSKLKVNPKGKVPRQQNWASLIPIINAKLSAQVKANMGAPSLVNRTGTFAESAKITSVATTDKGFPSFEMAYNKYPYGVFDRRGGALPWATPERDPYTIIEKSLRQILSEMAIGRFYLRRS